MDKRPADVEYAPPTLLRVSTDWDRPYTKVFVRLPLPFVTIRELRGKRLKPPYAVIAIEGAPGPEEAERRHARAFVNELHKGGRYFGLSSVSDVPETYEHLAVSIALPLEGAIALAHRHGQPDLHWFDGLAFWYVPVPASAGPPIRLPLANEDPWVPCLRQTPAH